MPAQQLRLLTQAGFLALVLIIGLEFRNFVSAAMAGSALPVRPPGTEGFLPISALMSLRLLLAGQGIHPVHPAGLFILLSAAAMSLVAGRAFCGWLCPFGLLSDLLYRVRRILASPGDILPKWADRVLSSFKYLLLGFFVWAVFFAMDTHAVRVFLDGDYNKIADVKMYFFFSRITLLAASVIGGLLVLSLAVPYFWCRYICPYGALLHLPALAAPLKIRRSPAACTACGDCSRACPQGIQVHGLTAVRSGKCNSCARCVEACPSRGALGFRTSGNRRFAGATFPLAAVLLYFAVIWAAMLGGHWKSSVASGDYLRLVPAQEELSHPGGWERGVARY